MVEHWRRGHECISLRRRAQVGFWQAKNHPVRDRKWDGLRNEPRYSPDHRSPRSQMRATFPRVSIEGESRRNPHCHASIHTRQIFYWLVNLGKSEQFRDSHPTRSIVSHAPRKRIHRFVVSPSRTTRSLEPDLRTCYDHISGSKKECLRAPDQSQV